MGLTQTNKNIVESSNTEILIRKVLTDQMNAWNQGDLLLYMNGYWKNDSLKFIGKNGIQYGWQNMLDAYLKSYPNKTAMGILTFSDINIDVLSVNAAYVIGKWQLNIDKGNVNGIFTLLFKQINGNWVIVCDHTS